MDEILKVEKLKKYYATPRGLLHAVDNVDFSVERGKTMGFVGESGCGKSTLGSTIIGLEVPTGGKIIYDGRDITFPTKKELKELRKELQMIFQDPFSSIDPRMSISDIIAEPLIIHRMYRSRQERIKKVEELMDIVGIARRYAYSYPHELDGGRRQRVGIARALAVNPKFIVCDEPVSALDVSIQAQVLNLLQDLQRDHQLTYLFITHDLSVVRHISDDICVMYLGQIVEKCSAAELYLHTLHPYTKALLSAIPIPDITIKKKRILMKGELSSPIEPKDQCRFAARCPYANEECYSSCPKLMDVGNGHMVACHKVHSLEDNL